LSQLRGKLNMDWVSYKVIIEPSYSYWLSRKKLAVVCHMSDTTWHTSPHLTWAFIFCGTTGFELRAMHLACRHSTTLAVPPALYVLFYMFTTSLALRPIFFNV
jgi:hypothetical protein